MTKEQALELLELPASASEHQMQQRLREKLEYFENLSENAPSEFQRRLHRQNLEKCRTVQREMNTWNLPSAHNVIELHLDQMDDEVLPEDSSLTVPVILSSSSKSAPKKTNTEPVAWLVRHTENQLPKTFPLFIGKNYIGRKLHPALQPFILVEEDSFVSRVHAVIFAEQADEPTLFIADNIESNGERPSKNGTFLNGNRARITDRTRMNEGDTIQVGQTKFMLRLNRSNNINRMVEEVKRTKFMDTVVLRG